MRLTARRTIDRPAAEVFDFLADARNNPRWQGGMVTCEWEGDGPIAVGAKYRQEARFLGRPVRSLFEVVAHEPGRMIQIETVESTFAIRVRREVEPAPGGGCVVTATIDGGPSVPWIVAPLVQRIAQRSVDRDYDRLVALLERGSADPG